MSVIKELRRVIAVIDASVYAGSVGDEWWEVINGITDVYNPKGYTIDHVDSSFEEGGRWTNVETHVYKIEENGETAYFSVQRDVPATESQEGTDCSFGIDEVVPQEVTVIKYVTKVAVN